MKQYIFRKRLFEGLKLRLSENQEKLWLQGGFPRSYLAEPSCSIRWLDDFSRTLLERDIPQLGLRVSAATLRRFWLTMSHYHGQTWNAAEVGRSFSVGPAAANHFRDILAGAYMMLVLSPWYENIRKRLVKSPKVYFRATGLLHRFLGVNSMKELRCHPRYGAGWEGFALLQILAMTGERDAFFWSTQRGAELDLMLIRNGRRFGFEFKCTDSPGTTRSMHVALKDLNLDQLWVVYPGDLKFTLGDRISALPLKSIGMVENLLTI